MLLSELARIWNFEEPNLMQKPPQRILYTCTKSSSMGHHIASANAWIYNAPKLRSKIQTKDLASSMQLFAHLMSLVERHAHKHTSNGKVKSALA